VKSVRGAVWHACCVEALLSEGVGRSTRRSWLETDAETERILREAGARDVTVTHLDEVKSVVWGRR